MRIKRLVSARFVGYFKCLMYILSMVLLLLLARSNTTRTNGVTIELDNMQDMPSHSTNMRAQLSGRHYRNDVKTFYHRQFDATSKGVDNGNNNTDRHKYTGVTAQKEISSSVVRNVSVSKIVETFTYSFEFTCNDSIGHSKEESEIKPGAGIKLHIGSATYDIPEPDCTRKQLIYKCSLDQQCCGLGDRQRGITSLFLLAMLTNRTFSIYFTKPCPLTNFYIPNYYNWTKCLPSNIRNRTEKELRFEDLLQEHGDLSHFMTKFWEDVIILTTNAYVHRQVKSQPSARYTLPWIFPLSANKLMHIVFHLLFKLTNSLQNEVDTYINQITRNHSQALVGVHIRAKYIYQYEVEIIKDFLRDNYANSSSYAIYLATDIFGLRHNMTAIFPHLHTMNVAGSLLHVDNVRAKCDSLYYAVLEQQILSKSEILFKTRSVLSQMAFIIQGSKGITFDFQSASYTPEAKISRTLF